MDFFNWVPGNEGMRREEDTPSVGEQKPQSLRIRWTHVKDCPAGVGIRLSGKRPEVLMASTPPAVPSSLGPELGCGRPASFCQGKSLEGAGCGALLSPSVSNLQAFLHSC